jgi:hypothetical protein
LKSKGLTLTLLTTGFEWGRSFAISIIAFMNEDFELPVAYKGKELLLIARLLQQGYTYKIEVEVGGIKLMFEKDDEGNWRALTDPEKDATYNNIDVELFKAIAVSLEAIFE